LRAQPGSQQIHQQDRKASALALATEASHNGRMTPEAELQS
jgi:hypothetical protein